MKKYFLDESYETFNGKEKELCHVQLLKDIPTKKLANKMAELLVAKMGIDGVNHQVNVIEQF